MRMKKDEKEEESRRSVRRPKARQTLGKLGKWLFLILVLVQHWLSVSAAAEGPQRKNGGSDENATRSAEQRKQRDGGSPKKVEAANRIEMKKEDWGALCSKDRLGVQRKKYMRRYKGKCDIFFGIEHRLRKEDMEEQFNRSQGGMDICSSGKNHRWERGYWRPQAHIGWSFCGGR